MEGKPPESVLQACRTLLGPVVRLLLRSGVSSREFAEAAKATFVDIASSEFGIRGRRTNVSRVAILTGINRRDVRKLRELLAQPDASAPQYLNPARRVLSGWHQDADFTTASSEPRELFSDERTPSFGDLWRRYGGDVPQGALLKELIAVGAVERTGEGRLRAASRVYIPRRVDPAKTLRAGSVLRDIGNTVVHDLLAAPREPLRFERRAENDRIDPKSLPAFREFLEREGMQFLERVDDWLTAHQCDAASGADRRGIRIGVGMYHIQDDLERGARK
jgi:hypothetical protein